MAYNIGFLSVCKFFLIKQAKKRGSFFLFLKEFLPRRMLSLLLKIWLLLTVYFFSFPWQELFMEVTWGRFLSLRRFLACLWSCSLVPYVFTPFSLYLSDVCHINFTLKTKIFCYRVTEFLCLRMSNSQVFCCWILS